MTILRITTVVEGYVNDDEDAEIVFAAVKDKALELRASLQLLHASGQTTLQDTEVRFTVKDARGERTLDLADLRHTDEEADDVS